MRKAFHGGGGIYSVIGARFEHIERNKEAANADGLDAWFDASPKAIAKLSEYLSFSIKTSPPAQADGLVEAISECRGIPKKNIIVAGGSSDLMYALFPNLGAKKVLILDPMYGEYRHIFDNVLRGIELTTHKLLSQNNFEIQPGEFVDSISRTKPDLVVIVNPNSPVGSFLSKKKITDVIENIPPKTLFIIDETYIDYVDSKESAETLVSKYKNLLIIKSMSKAYSLSGARVGYIATDAVLAEQIDSFIPPFSVSTPAQILAIEALKDTEYYQKKWKETGELQKKFIEELRGIPDIKIHSNEGNFFIIELLNKFSGVAETVVKKLAEKNVFVRNADSMSEQFNGSFIRIAVKDVATNKRIAAALDEVLR